VRSSNCFLISQLFGSGLVGLDVLSKITEMGWNVTGIRFGHFQSISGFLEQSQGTIKFSLVEFELALEKLDLCF